MGTITTITYVFDNKQEYNLVRVTNVIRTYKYVFTYTCIGGGSQAFTVYKYLGVKQYTFAFALAAQSCFYVSAPGQQPSASHPNQVTISHDVNTLTTKL